MRHPNGSAGASRNMAGVEVQINKPDASQLTDKDVSMLDNGHLQKNIYNKGPSGIQRNTLASVGQ